MNIQDLLKITGEQGKVVVVTETGELRGVFFSAEAYKLWVETKTTKGESFFGQPTEPVLDPEKINQEITQAQLEDTQVQEVHTHLESFGNKQTAQPLNNLIVRRAQELLADKPFGRSEAPSYDFREQVIDPSFVSGVSVDTQEEIKTNFEDI